MTNLLPNQFAVAMMVKNEADHFHKSFDSVKAFVDRFIILDTGSTDHTIEAVQTWGTQNGKTIHAKQTAFVNFAVSRNELLDFATSVVTERYIILMDASDELRGDVKLLVDFITQDVDAGFIRQLWQCPGDTTMTYYNIRIIKASLNWKYKGAVHEFISCESKEQTIFKFPDEIFLYQDRLQDGGKTQHRLERDYIMLGDELRAEPDNARTCFYYARTCESLAKFHEAITVYTKRVELQGSFVEELFWSELSMAMIYLAHFKQPLMALDHALKALHYCYRVEPLVLIGQHYLNEKKWYPAFVFLHAAVELPFPHDAVLFVNKGLYEYARYHLLSLTAFYCGQYQAGYDACMKAIEAKGQDQDKKNLVFYKEKLNLQ
jgi:glycosyltransferase involved in cell wall biosynthesis